MRTDDLVTALAKSAGPVDSAAQARQFSRTLLIGVLLSILAVLLFLGPRPDWRSAIGEPMFWIKLAFPAATAAAAFVVLRRLSYPGTPLGWSVVAIGVPAALVWVMAATVLASAVPAARLSLILGSSSSQCPFFIAALSLPAFVLSVQALRRLAPTRLALTGALAGLFAGAAAAFAYALHCVEMQAPFLAVWYVLGMAIPAAAGAVLGRRLLHW
jgi:hypothetical protein